MSFGSASQRAQGGPFPPGKPAHAADSSISGLAESAEAAISSVACTPSARKSRSFDLAACVLLTSSCRSGMSMGFAVSLTRCAITRASHQTSGDGWSGTTLAGEKGVKAIASPDGPLIVDYGRQVAQLELRSPPHRPFLSTAE